MSLFRRRRAAGFVAPCFNESGEEQFRSRVRGVARLGAKQMPRPD